MNKKQITVEKMFEIVWRDHWSSERFLKSGHAAEVRRNYKKHIEDRFGQLLLVEVTRLDIRQWHFEKMITPIAANRSLETLSKIFSFAIEQELYDGSNPCFSIKTHREKRRRRFATEQEIERIGKLLIEYAPRSPRGVAFLYALIFSGARPRSIERALWQDLTILEGGYGKLIFEGKETADSGDEEMVIFPPQLMSLISLLPKRRDGKIFGIRMPKEIWGEIRAAAGCPDLWARDLRRTFATVGRTHGVQMDTIAELLNHKSTQTTKIYAKLVDTVRLEAVEKISNKLTTLLYGTKAVNE